MIAVFVITALIVLGVIGAFLRKRNAHRFHYKDLGAGTSQAHCPSFTSPLNDFPPDFFASPRKKTVAYTNFFPSFSIGTLWPQPKPKRESSNDSFFGDPEPDPF